MRLMSRLPYRVPFCYLLYTENKSFPKMKTISLINPLYLKVKIPKLSNASIEKRKFVN